MKDGMDGVVTITAGPGLDLGPVLDRISLSLYALAGVFILVR